MSTYTNFEAIILAKAYVKACQQNYLDHFGSTHPTELPENHAKFILEHRQVNIKFWSLLQEFGVDTYNQLVWLLEQVNNPLAPKSSGSLYTALGDMDFITNSRNLSEEEEELLLEP